MKKYTIPLLLAVSIVSLGHFALAQSKPISKSMIRIVATVQSTVFTGTIDQLEARKKSLIDQIKFLQDQLDRLNQPYETIPASN